MTPGPRDRVFERDVVGTMKGPSSATKRYARMFENSEVVFGFDSGIGFSMTSCYPTLEDLTTSTWRVREELT